jgi:hypothetical protein
MLLFFLSRLRHTWRSGYCPLRRRRQHYRALEADSLESRQLLTVRTWDGYHDEGHYSIRMVWTDQSGAGNPGELQTTVANSTPVFDAGSNASIRRNSQLTRKIRFRDPGRDAAFVTVDYGDGTPLQRLTPAGRSQHGLSAAHCLSDRPLRSGPSCARRWPAFSEWHSTGPVRMAQRCGRRAPGTFLRTQLTGVFQQNRLT